MTHVWRVKKHFEQLLKSTVYVGDQDVSLSQKLENVKLSPMEDYNQSVESVRGMFWRITEVSRGKLEKLQNETLRKAGLRAEFQQDTLRLITEEFKCFIR